MTSPAFAFPRPVLAAVLAVFAMTAVRAQDPKPVPPPDKAALDAEREKLRVKDVEGWKKYPIKSMDQVIDVKKVTQPLEMPPTATDAEKAKIVELFQKAKDAGGGAKTGRALRELQKIGHTALIAIINELREIDYKNTESALWGMSLNGVLQDMTMGINAGYVAIEVGEPMDPRKAQWNAQTVEKWQQGVKQFWSTKEKFEEYIKNRKAKKDAELEGDTGKGEADKGKGAGEKGEKKGG